MMIAVVVTARKDRPKGVEEKSQSQHERCGSVEEMRALRFRQRHHGLEIERDGFVQGMEYALEGFPLDGNIQIQAYRLPLAIAAFSVTPENLAHSSLSLSNGGSVRMRSTRNRYAGGAIPIMSIAHSELRSNRNHHGNITFPNKSLAEAGPACKAARTPAPIRGCLRAFPRSTVNGGREGSAP